MAKFKVMETSKDENFPCKEENFPRIMANMVKFNELYQVTLVKLSKCWPAAPKVCGSNPAESFKH
jgi:hypothetical protein